VQPVAKQFTLGKNERLKSRKQIEQLFSEGKKVSVTPFRIFYLIDSILTTHNSQFAIQFGIAVSTKNFKRAVDRNRIKRLTREAWRLQKNELAKELKAAGKQLNVFFIYTEKEIPEYNWVYEKTKAAIQKLIKAIEEQEKL
jgi:ribonuclease P protein component